MIEVRHLRYFAALAEDLHFTRAAARLHLAQPALSQNIRQLEEIVGTALVTRTRRSVRLTDAGREFYVEAVRTLQQIDLAVMSARRAGRGETGRLVVGVTGLALLSILPDDLRRFRRKRPGADVSVREVAPERLFDALTAGDVDLVYSYAAPAINGVRVIPRVDEPLLVAAPERHVLATQRTVAVSALASERIIMPTRASGHRVHERIRSVLEPASPREVHQVGLLSTAVGLVAAGLGVAIVPASIAALARRGVCYRPLRPRATLTMSAACREADDSPVLAAFIHSLGQTTRRGPTPTSTKAQPTSWSAICRCWQRTPCHPFSCPHGFDDADGGGGGDYPRESEIGFVEKCPVLRFSSLLPWRRREHGDVEDLAGVKGVAAIQHHLQDQQSGRRRHRAVAVTEDGEALLLAPVVDDVRQQVEIASRRNPLEEAARAEGHAVGHPAGLDQRRGAGGAVRQIEECAVWSGMAGENRRQQVTGAAADVGDV